MVSAGISGEFSSKVHIAKCKHRHLKRFKMSLIEKKPVFIVPTRSDTDWPAKLQGYVTYARDKNKRIERL